MQGGRSPLVSKARQIFFQIVLDFWFQPCITHLMKTYYYIAYRKPRGMLPRLVCDGLWYADTKGQARREIARDLGVPISRLVIVEKKS